ncbi:hypothetical protein BJX70DRAFT_364929 [Aspergillus crustosus]
MRVSKDTWVRIPLLSWCFSFRFIILSVTKEPHVERLHVILLLFPHPQEAACDKKHAVAV